MFLSANVGVGHVSAAKALCASLQERNPHVETNIVDSYEYAAPVVSSVISQGYLQMVKTVPRLYRYIYGRAERAAGAGPLRVSAQQFTAGNLRPLIERERPDVVVCTHAFPCGAMAQYKRMYADAPPVVGIVTDFAVHGFWMQPDIDAYAVATLEMRERMIANGLEARRIRADGIPIHPRFLQALHDPMRLREKLALPPDRKIVLIMGGGLGLGPVEEMIHSLEESEVPVCAVVIAGRNAKLENRVKAAAAGRSYPVVALQFVENVDEYMRAADVLLTKPGGLTSAEALVCESPMVLFAPLPGQEERNARYLVERGAAFAANSAPELSASLRELLRSAHSRERMKTAMREIARPQAARRITQTIETLAQQKEVCI